MEFNPSVDEALSQSSQKAAESILSLGTDEKLALLYYIYEKMGESITPAAPSAADPQLAPTLLGDFYNLSADEQLQIMRDIASGADSDYSRAYGGLAANNKLVVWFAWAQGMGRSVVDMPGDYQASEGLSNLLADVEKLDFEEQITVLREVARKMGYSSVKPIPTQAETGKTSSL